MSEPRPAVLCYVEKDRDGIWAYFTTEPLEEQWGDDWGDAPYEHNAGLPYGTYEENGRTIHVRCIIGDFTVLADLGPNSPFSVQDINAGVVAWLWSRVGDPSRPGGADRYAVIPAGVTMAQCRELARSVGGDLYKPSKLDEPDA